MPTSRFGSVEDDQFVINDVILDIPPQQIRIEKQSFGYNFQTLRTVGSQTVKSGHSSIRVVIDITMKNMDLLSRMVAGLRATPFAVVYNQYLYDQLQSASPDWSKNYNQYKIYQPIVLALNAATFSTMGHINLVDCVQCQLDFTYFNYFPYTPVYIFKTGEDLTKPGLAKDSPLWQAFYRPFLPTALPEFPHVDPAKMATTMRFLEFMMLPEGSQAGLLATKELVQALKNEPQYVHYAMLEILDDIEKKKANIDTTNVYDTLRDRLIAAGKLTSNLSLQQELSLGATGTTTAASPVIDTLFQKTLGAQIKAGRKMSEISGMSEIQDAVSEIERRATLASVKEGATPEGTLPGGWSQFSSVKSSFESPLSPKSKTMTGMKLYSRARQLTLSAEKDLIVDQITVSIQNILASIPMVGYTYPTCQHLGSTDTVVVLSINASNSSAVKLQRFYDLVECTDRHFKQVPQGIRNVFINNDFLRVFGVSEFFINGLTTGTIPEQPGRSSVTLELQSAAVTAKTPLEGPEVINQEFLASSDGARKSVWEVLQKYLRRVNTKNTNYSRESDGWKIEIYGIVKDGRNDAFYDLLVKARDYYNTAIAKLFRYFYEWSPGRSGNLSDRWFAGFGAPGQPNPFLGGKNQGFRLRNNRVFSIGTDRVLPLKTLLASTETQLGFVPGMPGIKKMLGDMLDLVHGLPANTHQAIRGGSSATETSFVTAQQKLMTKVYGAEEVLSADAQYTKTSFDNDLDNMSFKEYQRNVTRLLDDIIQNWLYLDEFSGLAGLKQKTGIMRGRMAYPDFAPQLTSVASFMNAGQSAKDLETTLIDYDPDIYLWYPANQANATPDGLLSIVDPSLISLAKERTLKVFETAQGDVNDFFQKKYIEAMKNSHREEKARGKYSPYEQLTKNLKKTNGTLAAPLYNKVQFPNALRAKNDYGNQYTILHEICPDPNKLFINWPKEHKQPMSCKNEINHSTDLYYLWEGVGTSTGIPVTATQQSVPRDLSYQPPPIFTEGSPSITGSGYGVEPKSFSFFPPRKSKQTPSSTGYVCPVASYEAMGPILGPRPIDQSPAGWRWRPRSARSDWTHHRARLTAAGYVDPSLIEQDLHKPITSVSYNEYRAWSQPNKESKVYFVPRKIGYLHKGVDLAANNGTDVYAVANGKIKQVVRTAGAGAGLYVYIHHDDGRTSGYMHLQAIDPKLKVGMPVGAGDCIGVVGHSGLAKGDHLHFEMWSNFVSFLHPDNVVMDPTSSIIGIPFTKNVSRATKGSSQQSGTAASATVPAKDITAMMTSPLGEAIKEYNRECFSGQGQSLLRAYPTFKLYFIEEDSDERKRLAFDDFFSYNAVKSIRVVRSREIAADLCVLELTNLSGVLTNRKFKQDEYAPGRGTEQYKTTQERPRDINGNIVTETTNPSFVNTAKENPIASLMLQEGTQIHLRMGYKSDPDLLSKVFTGRIVNVEFSETDDLLQITAQSYATELVQDIKGLDNPSTYESPWWSFWGFKRDASTDRILEEMMSSPEVLHFGRWDPNANGTFNRELLTNKWQYVQEPSDDNIFAPDPATEQQLLGNGVMSKSLNFKIYKTTIWDIFKEMELRHPNFIASPVPYTDKYGERMTMFFGMPNQLYFARHPTVDEEMVQNKLKAIQSETIEAVPLDKGAYYGAPVLGSDPSLRLTHDIESGPAIRKRLFQEFRMQRLREAQQAGYIRPFRRYHMITSAKHIVQNNIQTNTRDVANTIVLNYQSVSDEVGSRGDAGGSFLGSVLGMSDSDTESLTLKVDNAIPTDDMRVQTAEFINVTNDTLATRYATGLLCRNLKQAYKGELIIIGNPDIKPHDIIYCFDEASDMVGPIEVRQVVHLMDQDSGFVTEITPDMLVAASDWSLFTSTQALGIVIAGSYAKMAGRELDLEPGGTMLRFIGGLNKLIMPDSWTQALISYTQLAQPVIMHPLTHHGRPFAGGLPLKRLPHSLWRTILGSWYNESDAIFGDYIEDLYTSVKNAIRSGVGMNSIGSFWDGFRTNTVEVD